MVRRQVNGLIECREISECDKICLTLSPGPLYFRMPCGQRLDID